MSVIHSLGATVFPISICRIPLFPRSSRTRILCNIGWDPEGLLGPPQTGLIANQEFRKRLEKDADAREAFEQQVREDKQRRQALRKSRVVPDGDAELIEYFLDTEAREMEFEITRLNPRLNDDFFSHLQFEIGQLRFATSRTHDKEDRLVELQALQTALVEGTEAYNKMHGDLVKAKGSLTKIFTSNDVNATLLDMMELNELNRSVLTLLDENIANARKSEQKQVSAFLEKLRSSVLKYLTVP